MPARFIVFEGPDGAGTTTQVRMQAELLGAAGVDVLVTEEPSTGPIGVWIRQLLKTGGMDAMALQLLFTADRAWHVHEVIKPALAAGKTVLCDRYWHSTVVYAQAQGLDAGPLQSANESFLQPDLVIFTLPPLAVCLERMNRRAEKDFFEQEALQRKIHDSYHELAKQDPRIAIVDTSASKAESAATIATLLQKNSL